MFLKYKLLTSHKSPRNIDQKLAKFIVLWVPWMIYFSSFMQLFYVRQAIWYMEFINNSKGNVPLRLEDIKFLKLCSLWFFVAISAYMVLPVRRIISEITICCKKFSARPNTKLQTIQYNIDNYDAINPLTKSEGRVRHLKEIKSLLDANLVELTSFGHDEPERREAIHKLKNQIEKMQEIIETEKVNSSVLFDLQDFCFLEMKNDPQTQAKILS